MIYFDSDMSKSTNTVAGADPGFQVRGGAVKKLRRAEGGAKIFGVFHVKNHDFTSKNHIFSNFRIRPWLVYFDWKTVIYIYVCGKCRTQFMLPNSSRR